MDKIEEIIIGTNNQGKYKEICDLLPKKVKKYSPKEFNISTPRETGKSFGVISSGFSNIWAYASN